MAREAAEVPAVSGETGIRAVGLRLGCCRGYGMQGQGEELGQKVTVGSWRASRVMERRVGSESIDGLTQKVMLGSRG